MSEIIPEMSEELLHKAMALLTISLGNRDEDWQADYKELYDQYYDFCGKHPESKLKEAYRLKQKYIEVGIDLKSDTNDLSAEDFGLLEHVADETIKASESAISEMFTEDEIRRLIVYLVKQDDNNLLYHTDKFIAQLKAEKGKK